MPAPVVYGPSIDSTGVAGAGLVQRRLVSGSVASTSLASSGSAANESGASESDTLITGLLCDLHNSELPAQCDHLVLVSGYV